MKYIIILSLFLLSHAHAKSLEEVLTDAIASEAKSFDPQKKYYHYFTDAAAELDMQTSQGRIEVAEDRAFNFMIPFWNPSHVATDLTAGFGFYAATDPYSSGNYGNTLIELSFAKNNRLKYLSIQSGKLIRYLNSYEFDEALGDTKLDPQLALYFKDQIALHKKRKFVHEDDFFVKFLAGNKVLKKMLLKIFSKLHIVGFEYGFTSLAPMYCANANNTAFVFFGNLPDAPLAQVNMEGFQFKVFRNDFKNMSEQEKTDLNLLNQKISLLRDDFPQGTINKASQPFKALKESTLGCED